VSVQSDASARSRVLSLVAWTGDSASRGEGNMGSKLIVWVAALCLLPLAGCNCRSIDTHEDTDDTDQVDLRVT